MDGQNNPPPPPQLTSSSGHPHPNPNQMSQRPGTGIQPVVGTPADPLQSLQAQRRQQGQTLHMTQHQCNPQNSSITQPPSALNTVQSQAQTEAQREADRQNLLGMLQLRCDQQQQQQNLGQGGSQTSGLPQQRMDLLGSNSLPVQISHRARTIPPAASYALQQSVMSSSSLNPSTSTPFITTSLSASGRTVASSTFNRTVPMTVSGGLAQPTAHTMYSNANSSGIQIFPLSTAPQAAAHGWAAAAALPAHHFLGSTYTNGSGAITTNASAWFQNPSQAVTASASAGLRTYFNSSAQPANAIPAQAYQNQNSPWLNHHQHNQPQHPSAQPGTNVYQFQPLPHMYPTNQAYQASAFNTRSFPTGATAAHVPTVNAVPIVTFGPAAQGAVPSAVTTMAMMPIQGTAANPVQTTVAFTVGQNAFAPPVTITTSGGTAPVPVQSIRFGLGQLHNWSQSIHAILNFNHGTWALGNSNNPATCGLVHELTLLHGLAPIPETALPPPVIPTSSPPTLPNWDESCKTVVNSLSVFVTELLSPQSAEFQALLELLPQSKFRVAHIQRIVNNDVWKKFENARKALMMSKSADFELLSQLGLTDKELQEKTHVSLNHKLEDGILDYADNVALLFHGSRGNIDDILQQGLDDRLSRLNSRLGGGIYFSDDPCKAAQYDQRGVIFLCAVTLGDCAAVPVAKNATVREPKKEPHERRNPHDIFFDSVVSRPANANEFAVYNRNQCVPLYLIHYTLMEASPATQTVDTTRCMYQLARETLPPFIWTPVGMQTQNRCLRPNEANRWPFFAQTIVNRMKEIQASLGHSPESPPSTPFQPGAKKIRRVMKQSQAQTNLTSTTTAAHSSGSSSLNAVSSNQPSRVTSCSEVINGSAVLSIPASVRVEDLRVVIIPNMNVTPNADGLGDVVIHVHTKENLPTVADQSEQPFANGTSTRRNQRPQTLTQALNGNLESTDFIPPTITYKNKIPLASNDFHTAENHVTFDTELQFGRDSQEEWYIQNINVRVQMLPPQTTVPQTVIYTQVNQPLPLDGNSNTYQVETPMDFRQPGPECLICTCEMTAATCKSLTCCAQDICVECNKKLEVTRQSMSRETFTFFKCPFCGECTGTQIGICPDGTMRNQVLPEALPGYNNCCTIQITYEVNQGRYTTKRVAYVPETPEGIYVSRLLRIAFNRRLIFTIGDSVTTGESDVLVWNIHHKTDYSGGAYGYPDPTYLSRVTSELSQYGIH